MHGIFFIFIFLFLSAKNDIKEISSSPSLGVLPEKKIEGWAKIPFDTPYSKAKTDLLKQYPWLIIKDDSIEDLPETRNETFIRAKKSALFEEMALFFDKEKKLYLVRLHFSKRHFSFLNLLRKLQKKYGKPHINSFKKIVWKGTKGNIELFRNRVVRYIRKNIGGSGKVKSKSNWNAQSPLEIKKKKWKEDVLDNL